MINGRLIECDIKQIKYHREENMGSDSDAAYTYVVAHADWTENISPDNFYATISDFKSNKAIDRECDIWLCQYLRGAKFSDGDATSYVIDNGNVKKVVFPIKDITFNFNENQKLVSAVSPDVPVNGWEDEQKALDHLDVEVVNADGSMQRICGAASLIKLDDEQKEVVDEICALIKKAKDMGVHFIGDYSGCYAFNKNYLDKFCICYDNELEYSEKVDVLSREFRIDDLDVIMHSEDDMMYFERKK